METAYTIMFGLSLVAWIYTIYRSCKQGFSLTNMFIALEFILISSLGMKIYG